MLKSNEHRIWIQTLETLLASAVIAAIVSAAFSVLTSERSIAAENVIRERKAWRDRIRELSIQIFQAIQSADVEENQNSRLVLRAKFGLLVNPHERMDQEILNLVVSDTTHQAEEFIQRVELLLKHDWERAKYEASLLRWLRRREPQRVPFEEFRPGDEHGYRHNRTLRRNHPGER